MDNKRYGSLYEHTFVVEALRRDLQPHMPIGDYTAHDVVLYNGDGECFRVQVKGTAHMVTRRRRTPRFKITSKMGGNYRQFDCKLFEILAAYVAPVDTWYLIPCEEVDVRSVWLYPTNKDSKAKYESYRENWEVFK